MLKKIAVASVFFLASTMSVVPAAQAAEGGCQLNDGCYYYIDGSGQGRWICEDWIIEMECRNP